MDENENVSSDGIHCSIGEIVVACDGRGPAVVPPLSPHLPPFPYPFRTETRSNGVLSFLPSKTSPPPCRSFTSPTLLSAPSATVSGVIGWPCILSLSVTAQACGSSSFRRREKERRKEGARLTLEKELSFETFDKLCCCDANFLVGSIYLLTKSLSFDVAGQRCWKKYRTSEFGGFFYTQDLYIYTYTCDTDGYKYIYIYTYIFVTSERQSLQSDRWKVVFFEGRKEMRRTRLSTS